MIKLSPETVLANAETLKEKGDKAGALQTLQAGRANFPEDAEILLALGQLYIDQGDNNNATPVLENASEAFFKAGNAFGVISCLERLSALQPDEKRHYSDLARFYANTQQFDKAYTAYLNVWDDATATAFDYAAIGDLAFHAQKVAEAIEYLEKAVAMEPKNSHSWMYLGRCYAANGDKKAAIDAFKKSIAANPHFLNAYFFLGEIEKFEKNDPAFATLEGFKTHENLKINDKGALGFALGRMYHGVGDYGKAFENFKLGNDSFREHFAAMGFPPNSSQLDQSYRLVAALYSPENRKKIKYKGSKSHKPIFIIGLPRSGTTLLEQIMAAHSEISTAGELPDMTHIHRNLMVQTSALMGAGREAALLQAIDDGTENNVRVYLEKLDSEGAGTPMVIDKMPQNFMQLGLINVLFPHAKIITINRDPLDVGLSMFCNQFSHDWTHFHDLGDIGFYIRKYYELMAAWKKSIDLPIYDVDYQALVENPEGIARGVIEFCGLDWQPECLEFYKKRSQVLTTSVMQVRRPVNRSGLGKWKAYEQCLGPLKAALEQ